MRSNEDLQTDVQDAIKWEPLLNTAEIIVIANDGVITLTGIVDSFSKKSEARDAAKNVSGVKDVVENIDIQIRNGGAIDDGQIASEVLKAMKWHWEVPSDKIKIKVVKGWVTLEGVLPWHYQKLAAKASVNNLVGIKGVTNNIRIKSKTSVEIDQKDIEQALGRNWAIVSKDIRVKVSGNSITLIGTVDSMNQKDIAENIAWKSPGVNKVENELVIEYM